MKIALLISGKLGLVSAQGLLKDNDIICVFSDKNSVEIIDFCKKENIPFFIGNPRNNKAGQFISEFTIDVLLSINYMFLIERDLINWPLKYAINFHGSLLPKYRGRTPHVWAIINNEKETGITAHLINEQCDEGEIIEQIKVEIEDEDTGANILDKYFALYPDLIETVLQKIKNNTISFKKQNVLCATYFGKRTPEDGRINWNWQKERIKNWVRAQSYPYPGSFSFVDNKKVILDKVCYSNLGFNNNQKNGTIVSTDPKIAVKTPNGVIELEKIRNLKDVKYLFKIGDVLN